MRARREPARDGREPARQSREPARDDRRPEVRRAADREGCGEYRIIAPSRALFRAGAVHACATMRLLTAPEIERLQPDSLVFQRQLEWGQIEVIERVPHVFPSNEHNWTYLQTKAKRSGHLF